MDIEGLGDKLVDQLVDQKAVRSAADLYRLGVSAPAALERMGKSRPPIWWTRLPRVAKTTLQRFLFGLVSGMWAKPPHAIWRATLVASTRHGCAHRKAH